MVKAELVRLSFYFICLYQNCICNGDGVWDLIFDFDFYFDLGV